MTTSERVPQTLAASPSWITLGDRIAKARKIAGLDGKQLAEKSGIHRNTLAKYEDDKGTPPRPYMLKAIAIACRVSYRWLETGEGHPDDSTDRDLSSPDRASDLRGDASARKRRASTMGVIRHLDRSA